MYYFANVRGIVQMLQDSLSAGASNSQNSSGGVGGSGSGSGGGGGAVGGGGIDKGGQMSHNAARHKIAIKPKKNHGRRRPVRATPTEPSLPATPEERTTPSTADDEAAIPPYNQALSNSNSAAELLDIGQLVNMYYITLADIVQMS